MENELKDKNLEQVNGGGWDVEPQPYSPFEPYCYQKYESKLP